MLKEALDRPGVAEVMKVYRNCQPAQIAFDLYRAATKPRYITVTTDRTSVK